MKKILVLLVAIFSIAFYGCNKNKNEDHVIKVGATPVPHAQILEFIKPELKKLNYDLKVISYIDYVTPNEALKDGSLDANYFQHLPFLQAFNQAKNANLQSAGTIHIEPLAIYSHQITNLDALQNNDQILIPNDPSNLARALILLDSLNIIKLKDSKNLNATLQDVIQNDKNIKLLPVEAAMLSKNIDDKKVKAIIINGNYALQAKLQNPIAQEGKQSPYANIIAVRKDDLDSPKIKALLQVLQSEKTKEFITEQYKGEVIPAF